MVGTAHSLVFVERLLSFWLLQTNFFLVVLHHSHSIWVCLKMGHGHQEWAFHVNIRFGFGPTIFRPTHS